MFWGTLLFWRVVVGLIGAFGTAYLFERSGRDVTMGGLLGLAIGGIGGLLFLVPLWVYLQFIAVEPKIRVVGLRKRWYQWWN